MKKILFSISVMSLVTSMASASVVCSGVYQASNDFDGEYSARTDVGQFQSSQMVAIPGKDRKASVVIFGDSLTANLLDAKGAVIASAGLEPLPKTGIFKLRVSVPNAQFSELLDVICFVK